MSTYKNNNKSFPAGIGTVSFASDISRTDTTAADLFTIPHYAKVVGLRLIGPRSNAGGVATISIGSSGGGGTEFLATFNVKSNGPVSYPSDIGSEVAILDPNPVVVTAVYAENGAASTAGGPWTIVMEVLP